MKTHLTASCSACLSGSIDAVDSPVAFSCVEDDAGERSVAPPPLEADPTAVDEGAEVTVTATPAEVVDEATAVSIARSILNVETAE